MQYAPTFNLLVYINTIFNSQFSILNSQFSIKLVTVLAGPTAVGKTDLSIALAKRWAVPIISADSRQCYRELAIGSAPPDAGQLAEVRHCFIADRSVTEPLTAATYAAEARLQVGESMAAHGRALVVGGSGLYIKALLDGFDDLPPADEALRQTLNARLEAEGLTALAQELTALDPAAGTTIDLQNPRRVVRALEVTLHTGKPFTQLLGKGAEPLPYPVDYFCLDLPRPELYARIGRRVEAMMQAGLLAEAEALYPVRHLPALQTVGYRELFDYMDGQGTLSEAMARIQQNTRRFAKRQMTWFRGQPGVRFVSEAYFRP